MKLKVIDNSLAGPATKTAWLKKSGTSECQHNIYFKEAWNQSFKESLKIEVNSTEF